MTNVMKPRVVKDYDNLAIEIQEQIKLSYPHGFDKHLVTFKNKVGKFVSALPFETEDRYYLIRMTRKEALNIIMEDDAYDDDGHLKDKIKEELEDKYDDELDTDEIDEIDELEDMPDDLDDDDDI